MKLTIECSQDVAKLIQSCTLSNVADGSHSEVPLVIVGDKGEKYLAVVPVVNAEETLAEKYLKDPKNRCLFLVERASYDAVTLIETAMRTQGVGRAEMARRMGYSVSNTYRMLKCNSLNIRQFAHAMAVLGEELILSSRPMGSIRDTLERGTS